MSDNTFNKFEDFFGKRNYGGLLSWLIRSQINVTMSFDKKGHLISRLVASSILFFIPSCVSGYLLQEIYNCKIMSYSLILTLLWGLISPFLLLYAATILNDFFQDHKNKFRDEMVWNKIYFSKFDYFFSSNYLYFGLPWSIIAASIITFVYFYNSPILIILWSFISFFYLALISSLGFHGVNTLVKMITDICSPKVLTFNSYHPDHFGGFSSFDRFVVRATLLFSSGTLIIPLAFEICYICNNPLYIYIIIFLTCIYIFMIGYCFFAPLLEIKNFVIREKESLILESLHYLNKMICDFKEDDNNNLCLKNSIEVLMYYHINHSRLECIKTSPWDFKSLLEFSFSVLLPSVVTLAQITKIF